MVVEVSRNDVIAFRLQAQNLTEQLDRAGMLEAAGACGVQNSPPGSALLALHARVKGVSQDRLDEAVAANKTLLQTWCMRGAPFHIPTADAAVFTTGVLPPTEEAMRQFIRGAGPAVDKLGLSLTETVELVGAEVREVLTGRRLAIRELGRELASRAVGALSTKQREVWRQEGPHAAGQPLGEAVVHFCIRILTLQKIVCFAPRQDNTAPFVLVDEWLDEPVPDADPESARAELLRRYLHCYGPSTRAGFATWLGVRARDVGPWWGLVEDELTQVQFGRRTWILSEDLEVLQSPPTPKGVHLLPPRDPFTQSRDRDTIVDKKYQKDVWKTVGDPGSVLVDGEVIGVWRPRKSGQRITVTLRTFNPLPARTKFLLQAEAEDVAALRGATSAEVQFDTY